MRFVREFKAGGMRRGLAISLALHGVVLAALLMHLPVPKPAPEEEVVAVTLVEPPEPDKPPEPEPEPPVPEPTAPEPPAPEKPDVSEPEVAPEPQAPEPVEEQAAPPPGAASPGELAAGEAAPIPVLRPVFRFGEEDSGPRQALDGNSADEAAPLDTDGTDPGQSQPAGTEAAAPSEPAPPDPETSAPETAGLSLPELTLPESGLPAGAVSAPEPQAPSVDNAPAEPAAAPVAAEPAPPPEETAAGAEAGARQPPELREAGELFSPDLTGDRAAMVAMGSLPRELRASQLCTTELREQLGNGRPRYGVELLPAYRLDTGNVLAVPNAAFRAGGAWYALSFRCTVDADAFRVLGFALSVGDPIPRAEWKARGFPEF